MPCASSVIPLGQKAPGEGIAPVMSLRIMKEQHKEGQREVVLPTLLASALLHASVQERPGDGAAPRTSAIQHGGAT